MLCDQIVARSADYRMSFFVVIELYQTVDRIDSGVAFKKLLDLFLNCALISTVSIILQNSITVTLVVVDPSIDSICKNFR